MSASTAPERPERPERRAELDVLRGIALLGILVVNIPFHGLPTMFAMAVPPPGATDELAAWSLTRVFGEAKFFSIFSLLFGMGLALQVRSLRDAGTPTWPVIARRHAFLAAVGLAHGVLLFAGDVLLTYAVVGLIAYGAARLSARVCVALSGGLLALALLLTCAGAAFGGPEAHAVAMPAPQSGPLTLEALTIDDEIELAALELRVFREGPVWAALLVRAAEYALALIASTFFDGFNARVLALMLLGVALVHIDALAERWRAWRRRFLAVAWTLGLALEVLATVPLALDPERGLGTLVLIAATHELGSLALAAAFALTIVEWTQSGALRWLARGIASAGRMAFTGYLGQSLIANVLFTGIGFGLYGRCTRVELLAIAVLVWCAQVAASTAWLARFDIGPLEWFWRAFTRWKRPRFVRARSRA